MYPILKSNDKNPNKLLVERPRKSSEKNLQWIERVLKELQPDGNLFLLLVGGKSIMDFRLRVAQSHLRHDLTASSWSHVVLLHNLKAAKSGLSDIYEISLQPEDGFGFPVPNNGLQLAKLKKYNDPAQYPNISLICLPKNVKNSELENVLKSFKLKSTTFNMPELMLKWLSFLWGAGKPDNPVFDGAGIPSSVMIEYLLTSLDFELTPNIPSNASTPEAIWQSFKWWSSFYTERMGPEHMIKGFYSDSDKLNVEDK